METLALIPARGGSKGIPGKNIRDLHGKPLLVYSIQAAQQAATVDRVIVSTDDERIAEVAKSAGADVIKRPAEISGDSASSEAALLHALEVLGNDEEYYPDLLVFLQCTSPLTKAKDIDCAVEKLLQVKADTCLTVAPFHYYLWFEDESGEASGINHNKISRPLRQQRENQFIETGAVYVMRVQGFLQEKHRFFGKTVMSIMPGERCWEIDDPADWPIAEAMLRFSTPES